MHVHACARMCAPRTHTVFCGILGYQRCCTITILMDCCAGPAGLFPWARLPTELQKLVMSFLPVCKAAKFVSALKCRSTRALYRERLVERHPELLRIMGERFGPDVVARIPPLDFANPGDVFLTPQVVFPSLLLPYMSPIKTALTGSEHEGVTLCPQSSALNETKLTSNALVEAGNPASIIPT
jgi:hypothetical protein